jgi:lipopolysaccharide export system permease protein
MVPVVVFALCMALPWVQLNDTFIPAQNKAREAIIDAVKAKGGAGMSTRSAFSLSVPVGNQTMAIYAQRGIDFGSTLSGQATMYGVVLTFFQSGKTVRFLTADRAEWQLGTKNWRLVGDTWGAMRMGDKMILVDRTEITTKEYAIGTPGELKTLSRPEVELTNAELRAKARLRRMEGRESDARSAETEIARRVALPFATLVFALVGAPLGVRSQREGKGAGFALAVGITFAYWMMINLGLTLGKSGALPPLWAVNLPNLIGLGVGVLLIRRVLR